MQVHIEDHGYLLQVCKILSFSQVEYFGTRVKDVEFLTRTYFFH
jgi:hypothetical protein